MFTYDDTIVRALHEQRATEMREEAAGRRLSRMLRVRQETDRRAESCAALACRPRPA